MDPRFDGPCFSFDDFNFESHIPLHDTNQSPNFACGFNQNEPALGFSSFAVPPLSSGANALNNAPTFLIDGLHEGMAFQSELDDGSLDASLDVAPGGGSSSSNDCDLSDPVMKYISQMLMDENIEEKFSIFPNEIALRNTEKSLYDVLGEKYPCLPDQSLTLDVNQFTENLSSYFSDSSSEKSSVGTAVTSTNSSYSINSNCSHDPREHTETATSTVHSTDQDPQANFSNNSPFHANSLSLSIGNANGLADPSLLVKKVFSGSDSILQFERGLEEASKFLPPSNQLIVSSENVGSGSGVKRGPSGVDVHDNKGIKEDIFGESRGRKSHGKGDLGLEEGRAAKQLASYMEAEEAELSDMLDKVLLWTDKEEHLRPSNSCLQTEAGKDPKATAPVQEYNDGKGWGRRQENDNSVDLRALLIQCARAISSNDLWIASELLKQIRRNSSPSGDGSQRLAHHFANGLEARMVGNDSGTQCFHASVADERRSMVGILKAFQLHLLSCPFKKFSIAYMNHMIWKLSQKASILHIIDFGVSFGFQWPILIQKLGEQAGGPTKLRITGIELPQPGFRPAEGIEETGRRLARYCERFNVPFEYIGLPSRNWEDIKIDDLKIRSGETIAVNCLMRFRNFLDETNEGHSPKDALLNLIRRIKPDIFVNAVVDASCSAPYFETRFKEALFHQSAIYDMLDATIPSEYQDSEERKVLESEFYGREIMNVVACEGLDRVERPESHKQWQIRHTRAGFKQLPLDQAMIKRFRHELEALYHKDFVLDEDGHWMLLGWKGRIIYATTCWVPA